jgi:hypothetical protein
MYGTKISPIGSDESTMTTSYFLSDALKNCTFEIEEKDISTMKLHITN